MRAFHKRTVQPWCIYLTHEERERFLSDDPEIVARMKEAFLGVSKRRKEKGGDGRITG